MEQQISSFSHPDQPVRHSYPLAKQEDGFSAALSLCMQTTPYMLMRLGLLVGFTLIAVIWLGLCGGIAYLFSGKDGNSSGGVILFLIGIGAPAGLFYWAKQYLLYLLKAGHIAVLTQLITNGRLPEGINQVEYGKKIVTEKFTQTNVMFAVDSLVTGAAQAFNGTLDWIANLLPFPGTESLMKVVHAIVRNATTFIDETILSYNLARNDENVWRSSADGLVYYAANVKPILKTAVMALVIEYAVTFGCFLVALIPSYIISLALPASVSGYAWAIAAALALCINSAFLHPIFLTMVALTFHKNVFNQKINETYSDLLSEASDKFVELKNKAFGSASPQVQGVQPEPEVQSA